ncbi:MAG: 16S rRNA (guanine(966)-N(2))-methyltransferase RsmD [Acidimicrobiia bacterium]|nr:16S rRNA (guanine(966)-N(2))-methyltransferase RsmD [Acidimicrobiia bacterium]
MRVIAGMAKGRRLKAPGEGTRPMMDRVREALFSSLGPRVPGAEVLDLYAGSGSIGLEALSRGAGRVVFVEKGRRALGALRDNVEAVGLGGEIVGGDVTSFLEMSSDRFDLAFVDPPYDHPLASVEEVLGKVASRLRAGGVVVVHRRAESGIPEVPGLCREDCRRYGDTEITRFVIEEEC